MVPFCNDPIVVEKIKMGLEKIINHDHLCKVFSANSKDGNIVGRSKKEYYLI